MSVFLYRGDPLAKRTPLGVHRYPSGIGWCVALPGRRFLAVQWRKPRRRSAHLSKGNPDA